jgi:hypothetical protein
LERDGYRPMDRQAWGWNHPQDWVNLPDAPIPPCSSRS